MKATMDISELRHLEEIEEAVIESLQMSMYCLRVKSAGGWTTVTQGGRTMIARHVAGARAWLDGLAIPALWLEHESAYDEMVGQPQTGPGGNRMRVRLDLHSQY